MNSQDMTPQGLDRRTFLGQAGSGVLAAALANLLPSRAAAHGYAKGALDQHQYGSTGILPHRPAAKRVVHLCMAGGPSHLETLDYKPRLAEMHGKPMPESYTQGQQIAQLQGKALNCLGPQHLFERYGQSGQEICSLFPHIAATADDLCIIRSMTTQQIPTPCSICRASTSTQTALSPATCVRTRSSSG